MNYGFMAQCCQNYKLYQKTLQIKVVANEIFYKELSKWAHMSLLQE